MRSKYQQTGRKTAAFRNLAGNHSKLNVLLIVLGCLLLGGMLSYGWFYDPDYRRAALVIVPVALWLVWRFIRNKECLAIKGKGMVSIPWLLFFPFVISLFYVIGLLADPVSVQGTWMQIIRWTAAGAWLIVLMHLGVHDKQQWIHKLVTACGLILSGGSLFQLYGWMKLEGAVYVSSNTEISALGFRLGGWLQYPNTLGAIAGAFAVYHLLDTYRQLQQLSSSLPQRPEPQSQSMKHACIKLLQSPLLRLVIANGLVLLHLTVLGLTESRGAWLAAVLVLIIAWLMVPMIEKLRLFLFMLWQASWASLSTFATASLWLSSTANSLAWIPMVGCLLSSTFLLLIGLQMKWRAQRKTRVPVIGASIIILVVTGLAWITAPEHASNRLTGGHYETASARLLIYQDVWRLWQERTWLGSGGDAWRQQFASIQREPYVGKEAHSVLADSLLDIGLVGTLIVGGMAAFAVIGAWRRHQGASAAVTIIAIHSFIDFDMAYGLVIWISLAWLVIAWLTPLDRIGIHKGIHHQAYHVVTDQSLSSPNNSTLFITESQHHSSYRHRLPSNLYQRATAWLITFLLGAAFVMSMLQEAGHTLYQVGQRTDNPFYLRLAVGLAPANTDLRLSVAEQLSPDGSLALLREGVHYERRGKALYRALAVASERSSREEEASAWWKAAIEADRFDKALQTEAIESIAAMTHRAAAQGLSAEARTLALAVQDCFSQYEAEARRIEALDNPANDKRFTVTPEARHAYASVYRLTWP